MLGKLFGMVLDIDRIGAERNGDKVVVHYTTTTLRGKIGEKLVVPKMRLFAGIDVPCKVNPKVIRKEQIMANPIFAQWNIDLEYPVQGIAGVEEESRLGKIKRRLRRI